MQKKTPGYAIVLFGAMLAGCASTPPRLQSADDELHGVVIGTYSIGGKSKQFEYVYAQATSGDKAESAGTTRVVLAARALSSGTLSQIFADAWTGEPAAEGIVVDIGADSSWEARFMTRDGLHDTFGITSSGGEAVIEGDRARGRIALSNQSDAGLRVFRASFNAGLHATEPSAPSIALAASLAGVWRIEAWKTEDGHAYGGEIDIVRVGRNRLRGHAIIRYDADGTRIEETFDGFVDGEVVRMFGVVDPDAKWIADSLVLRMEGAALSGESRDEIGKAAAVRLRKAR